MTDDCPVGCGRPHTVSSEFCLPCWQKIPIKEQRALSVAVWRRSVSNGSEMAEHAYQVALQQAIKAVTR